MKIIIAGQRRFGRDVAQLVLARGWQILAVSCPVVTDGGELDKLHIFALNEGLPVIPSGQLRADRIPAGCDLIIAAHCHDFISRKPRLRARLGAIGYHPSLLPKHRGRSAIEWAVRLREQITGGSIYWLSETVDGGPIAAQEHVFIRPRDTARDLWARELAPLGLKLFDQVFESLDRGELPRTPQNAALATWEPALSGVPPLHRPELDMLCASAADYAASAAA